MINVLHIINGASLGGISSMLLNYYRNIDRNKFHFDFIYSIDAPLGHNGIELQKLGANFFYVPKKSDGLWRHVNGIEKVINSGHYDVIHVHSNHTSYVALAVAKMNGINIRIAHAHNAVKGKLSLKHKLSRVIGIELNNLLSTKRLGCTKDALAYVFGKNSDKDINSIVIPNSIDVKKFAFSKTKYKMIRQYFGINDNELVFGTVGRLSKEKNIGFLIDVLQKLMLIRPCKLLVVGDGVEKKSIEKRIEHEGLQPNVILTGQRADVYDLLNAFDVFTIPSLNEGFSMAGLEAGANGLPMIISDTVPLDLGFLPNTKYISLGNPQEWAEAITSISPFRNTNAISTVVSRGYDIKTSALLLEEIYSGRY